LLLSGGNSVPGFGQRHRATRAAKRWLVTAFDTDARTHPEALHTFPERRCRPGRNDYSNRAGQTAPKGGPSSSSVTLDFGLGTFERAFF